jgi:hypothetical protein
VFAQDSGLPQAQAGDPRGHGRVAGPQRGREGALEGAVAVAQVFRGERPRDGAVLVGAET